MLILNVILLKYLSMQILRTSSVLNQRICGAAFSTSGGNAAKGGCWIFLGGNLSRFDGYAGDIGAM